MHSNHSSNVYIYTYTQRARVTQLRAVAPLYTRVVVVVVVVQVDLISATTAATRFVTAKTLSFSNTTLSPPREALFSPLYYNPAFLRTRFVLLFFSHFAMLHRASARARINSTKVGGGLQVSKY